MKEPLAKRVWLLPVLLLVAIVAVAVFLLFDSKVSQVLAYMCLGGGIFLCLILMDKEMRSARQSRQNAENEIWTEASGLLFEALVSKLTLALLPSGEYLKWREGIATVKICQTSIPNEVVVTVREERFRCDASDKPTIKYLDVTLDGGTSAFGRTMFVRILDALKGNDGLATLLENCYLTVGLPSSR